jgi:hypothetical protein
MICFSPAQVRIQIHSPKLIGNRTWNHLLDIYKTLQEIFDNSKRYAKRKERSSKKRNDQLKQHVMSERHSNNMRETPFSESYTRNRNLAMRKNSPDWKTVKLQLNVSNILAHLMNSSTPLVTPKTSHDELEEDDKSNNKDNERRQQPSNTQKRKR